jgi:hypothetical protein
MGGLTDTDPVLAPLGGLDFAEQRGAFRSPSLWITRKSMRSWISTLGSWSRAFGSRVLIGAQTFRNS